MVKIVERTKEYDEYAKKVLKLINNKKLIQILPTVLLAILSIVICIVAKSAIPLIIAFVALIYFLVINKVLSGQFSKLNIEIQKIVVKHYNCYGNEGMKPSFVTIIEDNKNISSIINKGGKNQLECWIDGIDDQKLYYISSAIAHIDNLQFASISSDRYSKILEHDFGKLIISTADIDHYRDSQMVCKLKESVLKIKFQDEKALDRFIPKKDFYYNTEKKDLKE